MPQPLRRAAVNRLIRRQLTAATAAEAIGPLNRNCEIFGVSKGQFSLIDIIAHCLAATGPANVTVSTWTAAGADLAFANTMLTDGRILTMRFIVDFSFPTRQPAYCAALRERFGDDAIRVTKTHAKFITLTNDDWHIVIRSSMNLNENRRLESYEISDSQPMAEYLDALIDELFAWQPPTHAFNQGAWKNMQDFERFKEEAPTSTAAATAARSTDTRKYFGDGRYSPDLRRAGLVTTSASGSKRTSREPQRITRKAREYSPA